MIVVDLSYIALEQLKLAEETLGLDTSLYEVKQNGLHLAMEVADDLMDQLMSDEFNQLRYEIWYEWAFNLDR